MKPAYLITLMLAAAVIAAGVYTSWPIETPTNSFAGTIAPDASPAAAAVITTAHPALRTFTLRVDWIGTVKSQASIELTARVAGVVEAIDAEDQQPIESGQSVMRLGGPQIDDSRAKLTAEIKSLETQIQLARETRARLEARLKTRLATRDQVAAAQEAEVGLEGQLRDAQLNLKTLDNQIAITAPMNGVFTNRRVSVGQDVSAGQVVGDIVDTERLRIDASLFPPRDIHMQGKQVTIRLNEAHTVAGTVRQVLPQRSSTGAVTVWIEGPQINTHLHPGQTVGGDIAVESRPDALAVPTSAVVYDDQDHPYVFVRKDGAYERLGIQTGMQQDGWVEVLSGVSADQSVVVKGAYELFYRQFNTQFKVQD